MSETTQWRKASKSNEEQSCVEQRRTGNVIEIRNSRDPDGPVLRFTRAEFEAWLDGARRGEFDHLL